MVNRVVKFILKSISYIIITIIFVFIFLVFGIRIFGLQVYTVLSGSMVPTYDVGSLIYVKPKEPNEIKVDDILTFKIDSSDTVVTHRVVEIVYDDMNNRLFKTQGDANDTVDENAVKEGNIIGKPVFTIPFLGYIATFIQTSTGRIISIVISFIMVLIVFTIDYVTDDKKKER